MPAIEEGRLTITRSSTGMVQAIGANGQSSTTNQQLAVRRALVNRQSAVNRQSSIVNRQWMRAAVALA
jgi:hypothetical protein